MKNIYAFTGKSPSVGYVGYISVSQHRSGEIAFSVRSEGDPAPLGIIILKPEQCEHLATNLIEFLNGEPSTIDTQRQRITELESQLAQCKEALKTANSNHEEFERKWYLATDELAQCKEDAERLAPKLPEGLIKDLLIAADLLHERWKAQSKEVSRRLAEHAIYLSDAAIDAARDAAIDAARKEQV